MLFVALAFAHPGTGSGSVNPRETIGHRAELRVEADAVELRYVAEVPEKRVLEEARAAGEPGYGTRLLETLAAGVHLSWNGADLATTRVEVPDAVKAGENRYLDFQVALRAALPAEGGRLALRNGNYPDEPSFFATSVTLDPAWVAESTSLLKVRDGRIRDNWHGAWVRDETGREPWVELRRAGPFVAKGAARPLPEAMAELQGASPLFLAVLALGLIPIAMLGRMLGRRARRLREG